MTPYSLLKCAKIICDAEHRKGGGDFAYDSNLTLTSKFNISFKMTPYSLKLINAIRCYV